MLGSSCRVLSTRYHSFKTPGCFQWNLVGQNETKVIGSKRRESWSLACAEIDQVILLSAAAGAVVHSTASGKLYVKKTQSECLPLPDSDIVDSDASSTYRGEDEFFFWALTTFVSCLPFVNWIAWLILAQTNDTIRRSPTVFYSFAALYTLPLLQKGLYLGSFEWIFIAIGVLHIQVDIGIRLTDVRDWCSVATVIDSGALVQAERIVRTEPQLLVKSTAAIDSFLGMSGAVSRLGVEFSRLVGVADWRVEWGSKVDRQANKQLKDFDSRLMVRTREEDQRREQRSAEDSW
eukprot:CAMPEP_0177578226 /NCGR_PEP_ID=MMETSP0419_2-20121207/229_1 /TAXON_ID=582737 /ORGANISM="Tetraselmis sp., Strain GSL018" /LENGTH=290 /DNA_ID=CAMNT_0019066643 /DNA_START=192 /DNA_END=1062 /DNA_ORIENTATION=-